MLIARAHMQQQSSSQRGWRFVPDTILPGYQWAPQWVPARTPTVHWARSAGRPWVARAEFSTADHSVRNTPKHGSGAMSIQGKNVGSKSTVDESMLCYDGQKK